MFWLQKIVYVFLNTLARTALPIYFKKITINGKSNIPKNCPTLIAPNHPNTMIDPVLMAGIVPGWVHFLANYGLFKHPISNFFMSKVFFSIPVKRQKDVAPGETVNNLATIKLCSKVLSKKGTIFMGPEATSYAYRRIRPLKDGIARIALTAAKSQKFKSGLIIQPIGTNYSDPTLFRSEIIINVGEPIYLDEYKDAYKKDKSGTAQKVMKLLRERMEALSIHTEDEIDAQFLEWTEKIARSETYFSSHNEQLNFDRKILPVIRNLRERDYATFEQIWDEFYTYFHSLESIKTDDISVKKNEQPKSINLLFIFLYYPFHLLANTLNIQWNLPEIIFNWSKLYRSYSTMVKILGGIISIPIITSIIFLIIALLGNTKWAFSYLILSLLLGMLIMPFRRFKQRYFHLKSFYQYPNKETIIKRRTSLVRKLKEVNIL